ncbi:YIP1 family protein [Shouchella patagoniensis]|uniref:YIP1 family protein n=1 Tax=Shouchella patagoniensis TaxID=228576 RepID=UPI0009952F09|nr:YIP1 family protein [Shouchella patagoniensis]
MEQLKQRPYDHDHEEFSFSKKPNIFTFIVSPIKQFERIKGEPIAFGPMFLILGLVLIGLIIPAIVGQGGLVDFTEAGVDGEEFYAEDSFYFEEESTFGNIDLEGLTVGFVSGIIVLALFAAVPPLFALLFMAFARMQNNRVSYGKLYSMTVFALLSSAIGFLYLMIMNTINGTYGYVYTAPSVFVTQENLFYPLLSTLEVSSIAFIILIVIGLMKTANFHRLPAIAIGGGIFALFFVMNVLGGL